MPGTRTAPSNAICLRTGEVSTPPRPGRFCDPRTLCFLRTLTAWRNLSQLDSCIFSILQLTVYSNSHRCCDLSSPIQLAFGSVTEVRNGIREPLAWPLHSLRLAKAARLCTRVDSDIIAAWYRGIFINHSPFSQDSSSLSPS